MTREWPERGAVPLPDLVGPLREAQERIRSGDPAGYEGLGIPSLLYAGLDIDETLTPESLEYRKKRGSDTDTVILGCAVQLGMEQGIRHQKQEQERLWSLLELVRTCLQAGDLKAAREAMELVMALR